MKKLIILILLSITLNVNAGSTVSCYQHDKLVGYVNTPINDEAVIGNFCFVTHKDQTASKAAERVKVHDEYSPECWEGKKDGTGVIGMGDD